MQFPPTSGKIIIDTSHGELEVELWCKETPKGCRNFIQLCLEGYYDNCKFHRLLPNFMIQGGDPTGTGDGGKSIYGQPFQDEFHSRISFQTRGLLAYSNSGPNTNESQFFITFDQCTWLDKKHTIFGRIVGNTIYNLMNMNLLDTDENDRPIYPVFIKTTQVIIDPFNITVKPKIVEEIPEIIVPKNQKPKRNKNISLLSFADEEDEDQQIDIVKISNSHDKLNDPKLKKEFIISKEELEQKKQKKQQEDQKKQQLIDAVNINGSTQIKHPLQQDQVRKKVKLMNKNNSQNVEDQEGLLNYEIRRNQNGEVEYLFNNSNNLNKPSESSENSDSQIEDEDLRQQRKEQIDEYEKLKSDVLQFKEFKFGSNNPLIRERVQDEKKLMSSVEQRRAKFLQNLKNQDHNEQFEEKIKKFKQRIQDPSIMEDKYHWLNHKLKFHIDSASAFSVIDNKQQVQDYHSLDLVNTQEYQKKNNINIDQLMKLSE